MEEKITPLGKLVFASKEEESNRLHALHKLHLLDSEDEESFDRITSSVAQTFRVPICLVSLIDKDRQWFKSCVGLPFRETEREAAFCQYAVASRQTVVVEDARDDGRFAHNRLVTVQGGIRFYAGAPLITGEGHILGTICIIDEQPRAFSIEEQKLLEQLATWVVSEIQLREALAVQRRMKQELEEELALAGRLQRQLCPKPFLDGRVTIKGKSVAAAVVSGDLFDFFWVNEERIFGYVADVMGHGVATALQASAVKVLMGQASGMTGGLDEKVGWVNKAAKDYMPEDYYFTALVFELDLPAGELSMVHAGNHIFWHDTPDSGWKQLRSPGMMLGLFEDVPFETVTRRLAAGDRYMLGTDGLWEFMLESGETDVERLYEDLENGSRFRDDRTAVYIELPLVEGEIGQDTVRSAKGRKKRKVHLQQVLNREALDSELPGLRMSIQAALLDASVEGIAMEVAVNEALNNAVDHGQPDGNISVTVTSSEALVVCRIRSERCGVQAVSARAGIPAAGSGLPGREEERGRGIYLMRSLTDRVKFSRDGCEVLLAVRRNKA
ncbi:hypothetical protein DNH61_16450 [Paenibacillus sambharensis]|uniref:Serine/threonine protein phosphatase n=1 Tax=Paenibacillus sambharensis TaxID=1803190 RepID=A0A2W1L3F6_9BACL|nr:SpoIIE family protein phosphatase [Paenibacillus sambharensis]PZD94558.1 hypothetical protein DNH61_16450 [Paenibacillus sambharensis]